MPNQYFAFDKYFVHDNAEIRNEVIGEVDYMNEIARRLSEGVDEAVENYRFGAGTEGETRFSVSDEEYMSAAESGDTRLAQGMVNEAAGEAGYKKALKGYRLIPNLEDVAKLEQMFGTFGAAYRQYGKKLNMRARGTENAFYIDEMWEDLCEAVPLLDSNAKSNFLG